MRRPSASPRLGLRRDVRDYLAACVWDAAARRVESVHGQPIHAWLSQVSGPGLVAVVEWEVGIVHDLGIAVRAAIPLETFEIVRKGLHDAETGAVIHEGKTFTFAFESINAVPSIVTV